MLKRSVMTASSLTFGFGQIDLAGEDVALLSSPSHGAAAFAIQASPWGV
jgi:hypothetical protein